MTTAGAASSDSASAVQTLKNDLGRLRNEVNTLASDAVRLPQEAIFGDLARQVRSEPLKSVAIAVGVGVVIGLILRR